MAGEVGFEPTTPNLGGTNTTFNWNDYRTFLESKYSHSWSIQAFQYSRNYFDFLNNPIKLETFSNSKKNNILKALIILSKYLGKHQDFKNRLNQYGIKPTRQDVFSSFLRIFNNNHEDLLAWYKNAQEALKEHEKLYLRFMFFSGIRKLEGIQSFNLIIDLASKNRLNEYFNDELGILEHFRFRDLFLRNTKNVYISILPKDIIDKIAQSRKVSYIGLRRHLKKMKLKLRINELRDNYGTFMVRHGLIREEVDLLQGRIPPSIFIRHYWSPSFKELKDRTLKAITELTQTLN
jgi:intergrase/recombinase